MPHRKLVLFATAVAFLLGVALDAQRGAADPPGAIERSLGRGQMTVVAGTLTGTVRDQSRALVSGAQVRATLESDANVEPHLTTTDQEGRFKFTGLPLGTYCLAVSQRGSAPTLRAGVQVRGAQTTNVPIVLGEQVATPMPSPNFATPRRPARAGCGAQGRLTRAGPRSA